MAEAKGKKKFRFKNKLVSLDSTSIDLCASLFDWAKYKTTKGAAKVHLLLDNEGYLPCFACITDGKSHDITVARTLQFQPGTILVMDKGYVDYGWWERLTEQGVYFVTRLKRDMLWDEVESRTVPPKSKILRDQIIQLRPSTQRSYAMRLRVVTMWDDQKNEELQFLTNHLGLGPTTIARIYKERWQIEIFFESSTWCTPLDVMEFRGSIALNRPLAGSLTASVLPRIAPRPFCSESMARPRRPASPATVSG